MKNLNLSMMTFAILIFSASPSRSQEEASAQSPGAADTLSLESQAFTQMEVETPTPVPGGAPYCDAETADLIAQRDLASTQKARLETELTAARTLINSLSGNVRTAQLIIRDLETQRADLESELGSSEGGQCPAPGAAVQCAASVSEVDALRAEVAACTEGTDPDAALQARSEAAKADTGIDGTIVETSEDATALKHQIDTLTTREVELMAEVSNVLEAVTALTVQRDRAMEDADMAQVALAEAVAERVAARDQLAEAEARMAEMRATAARAIATSIGALTVCDASQVAGSVVLADKPAARAFKTRLGVLGDDMEVLISPVPSIGFTCVLQPIAGLLAPASQFGKATAVDYGTLSQEVVDALPRSTDCNALLETAAVQNIMADAVGFGSAKRSLWVQDAGAPALCGSRNGQVGLLRVEPRNQSAVFFLTAQAF